MAASMFKVGKICRLIISPKCLHYLPKPGIISERQIHKSSQWMGVTELMMPSLSPTMEQGSIVKWYKKEGDKVFPGDVLCDIQTDKAVVSMDTEEEGILAKILKSSDSTDIKVGVLIGLMVDEGEDWQNVEIPAGTSSTQDSSSSSSSQTSSNTTLVSSAQKSHFMGPSVKKLIEEYGVNAVEIPHSGPHGVLIKSDVITYIESKKIPKKQFDTPSQVDDLSQPLTAGLPELEKLFEDIPHTAMRKTIAKRLTQSKSTIPHSYAAINCKVSSINKLRKNLADDGIKVSINDFIIKAASLALQSVPKVNSVWNNDKIQISNTVDISVAVATSDGLITPIVKNAANLTVDEISSTVRELAGRAREKKLQLHEFQGGSFSISNLGMFGIGEFTAVINPPQTAILAVGTTKLTLQQDGRPVPQMTVTLSYDSRVVDEIEAASFLEMFTSIIENPDIMVARTHSSAEEFF